MPIYEFHRHKRMQDFEIFTNNSFTPVSFFLKG